MKTKRINIKTSQEYREHVHRVADAVGKTASALLIEAFDEKVERLAKRNPRVAQIVEQQQEQQAAAA